MTSQAALVPDLRSYITDETFIALGYPSNSWQRRILWPFAWPPAHQFAKLAAAVDDDVERHGVCSAANRLLARFVRSVEVYGEDNIPLEGPLLIASNHPGAYDSVAIIGNLPRNDLKVIASGVPFLEGLPALKQHLIYTPGEVHGRMSAVRGLIRHMKERGVSLIFPSGIVDPDPDVLPGAEQALEAWSPSLELVLRKAPETKVQVTIVSGVLAPSCLRNPIAKLPKVEWRQRKMAEFLQVMQQLFFPGRFNLNPRISFGVPRTIEELRSEGDVNGVTGVIVDQARQLLIEHIARRDKIYGDTKSN